MRILSRWKLVGVGVATTGAILVASGASGDEPKGGAAPTKLDRGPYLQAVTSTSVTVCWRTREAAPSGVVYGKNQTTVVGDPGAQAGDHRVTIHGLKPGQSEDYKIAGSDEGGHFTTAPAADQGFRALVFGDSGDGGKDQLALAARMKAETFDLVLHTGDVVYPNGEDENYGANFFTPYRDLLRSHPIFCAIGNHDLRYSKEAKAQGYRNAFTTFANNPERSPFYYSFEWGDAKFISLETDILFKTEGPHVAWLERELASNTRRWLVVFMHVPLYSPGHHKDCAELQKTIGPLFEKYHVPLVLSGHEHLYERLKVHGWWSVLTGGGGAHLDKVLAPHEGAAKAESVYHYVTLDFTPDAIKGRAIKLDGSVLDEFSIAHE